MNWSERVGRIISTVIELGNPNVGMIHGVAIRANRKQRQFCARSGLDLSRIKKDISYDVQ